MIALAACTEASAPPAPRDTAVARCDLGVQTSPVEDPGGSERVWSWADGAAVPAGPYAVAYEDGCMRYHPFQGWTVHNLEGESFSWWLVSMFAEIRVLRAPGTTGSETGVDAFGSFEACVDANRALPEVGFEHAGGPLGLWLSDHPRDDNVGGVDGRNPSWRLYKLDGCDGLP